MAAWKLGGGEVVLIWGIGGGTEVSMQGPKIHPRGTENTKRRFVLGVNPYLGSFSLYF
jgi:hypothetical protein